jgi:hypothetical protein
MKNEIIFYIEESLDGGFEARALGHSIYTQGEDIQILKANIIDAIKCHFEPGMAPSPPIFRYQRMN